MKEDHKYYPKTVNAKLGYVVEECGEVMAAIGKTQRWGLFNYNPNLGPDSEKNCEWILRELQDLKSAISILETCLINIKGN